MDRPACPSYQAGFDACDPLGSVLEWSGHGPARVLRRRCRSEGIDRSPFEDAPLLHSVGSTARHHRTLPNKNQFTLNSALETHDERLLQDYFLPVAVNGDYNMSHERARYFNYFSGKPNTPAYRKPSPNKFLVTTLSNTELDEHCYNSLPYVEQVLEKDNDVMTVKQPLKSILNNPFTLTPPQGILKKPKNKTYHDPKVSPEGRRRQRASSESDNHFCSLHPSSQTHNYESWTVNASNTTKRAKDNTGSGYSYGSAIASVSYPNRTRTAPSGYTNRKLRDNYKEQRGSSPSKEEIHAVHILRTTAINNNETIVEGSKLDVEQTKSAKASGVGSNATLTVLKKSVKPVKKKTKKVKVTKMKVGPTINDSEAGENDARSRSVSPDLMNMDWHDEAMAISAEIAKLEKAAAEKKKHEEVTEHTSVTKLATKLNGTVVTPKKIPSKERNTAFASLHTSNPFRAVSANRDIPMELPESIVSCLRMSLFPRVPPYLKFIGPDDTPPIKVPIHIQKHLKWKLTTITPIVVKKSLTNSGFRLVKSECDTAECPQEETVEWIGIWGKHMKSIMFRAIKDGQKMNHFPGTFQIGRKDRLWRNLQKLVSKFGQKEFGIMPKTYVLPQDMKLLKHDWEKHVENNEKWIIKPPASARGTGIKVVSKWTQIPKKRPVVVQRYVSKPYLINGSKFDMRLYVLVTSVHPLRIYVYKDGLARFASVKYNDELGSLNDRYMHLTNYSINRLSKNYTPNEDFAACEGHKWTLQTLFHYLRTEKAVDTNALWKSMKDLVVKTVISGEASISSLTKANITSRYNCYELFGVDVLLDEDLKPWLLEVNISPSLHSASPLDTHVKGPLVAAVLNLAQFQVPSKTNLDVLSKEKPHRLNGLPYDSRLYTMYLSKEERDKHIIYTNMDERDVYLRDILSTLTPDDVRHLIQAEDELTQAGDMERVFPTVDTHKYLNYLSGPRYYNRLFDAWEARYSINRSRGVELLRSLCDIGYHLEVPPIPLKNDVDAPSPPASERPSLVSIPSMERSPSAGSVSSSNRVCGDALSQPQALPVLEPRA